MEFGIEAETSRTEQRIPEQYSLTVTEETDRYIVKGIFVKGQMVMLSLKDSHGQNHNYFISTAAQSFTAMCVGTFQSSEQQVDFKLNKEGLSGNYQVYLIVDDVTYDLNLELQIS